MSGRNTPGKKSTLLHFSYALFVLVMLALILFTCGCLQPGGSDPAGTATPSGTPVPVTTPAGSVTTGPVTTPVTAATSPVTVATTARPTVARTRPTVPARASTTIGTAAITHNEEEAEEAPVTAVPSVTVSPAKASDDPYAVSTTSLAVRIHDLINAQRTANGISPLSSDPALAAIALGHSADMAANDYFSHTDLSGNDPTGRGNAAGYTCRKDYGSYYTIGIGENIFQNNLYTSASCEDSVCTYAWTSPEDIAQSTVTGWMNSPGHRKNILTATYDREGIGVAISSDNKVYITENFC